MPLVTASDFFGFWRIDGAGSPIPDQVSGGRALTLTAGATSPRAASYGRRRGAEFRTSTFQATDPAVFRSPGAAGLNSLLYVSNKITSFTWAGRVRPQKTGLSSTGLTPVGGLFSATNMGGTTNLYDQPCFVAVPAAEGSSKLLVFIGGKVF